MATKNVSQILPGHSGGAVPDSHRSSLFVGPESATKKCSEANHQHTINNGNLASSKEAVK